MKNTNLINTVHGAVIGLVSGAAGELLMLSAILNRLPARSIIVACAVTGIAWAIAGGIFAYHKNKKALEK
ncbi:MAG: hypothetical protein K6G47_13885 [Clostridia bacterium]|nr:hypothetical protein [Clostridia bacterium]